MYARLVLPPTYVREVQQKEKPIEKVDHDGPSLQSHGGDSCSGSRDLCDSNTTMGLARAETPAQAVETHAMHGNTTMTQHVRQANDRQEYDDIPSILRRHKEDATTIAANARRHNQSSQASHRDDLSSHDDRNQDGQDCRECRSHNQSTPITISMILIEANEILKKVLASLTRTFRAYEEMNTKMMKKSFILHQRRLAWKLRIPPPRTHDPLSLPRTHDTSMTDKNNPPFLRQEEVTPVPTMATQLQLQPKQTDDATTATIAANARRHNQLRPKPIHWMFPPPRTHNKRF